MGDEELVERTLVPIFTWYISDKTGQRSASNLIEAAKMRDEALDHVLLFGPQVSGENNHGFVVPMSTGSRSSSRRLVCRKKLVI